MFKFTKKGILGTFASIGILASAVIAVQSYINNWEENHIIEEADEEIVVDRVELEEPAESVTPPQPAPVVETQPEKSTDEDIQHRMHEMTHQKVIAEQRWGYIPMTPESIETTIQLVEYSNDNLEHYDFYIEALHKWQAGDFSNCVYVHNQIWEWEGGELGKATRLATAQEEQDFISSKSKK
ncbi:DUF6241 domain-containing protein [Bacillus sp. 165]|uniref:DUF6241 domain-containing protein n=1 Tax=Bacillus sp. 165 TaxID=1529117 RepID=UPI001ADB857A|nr:DUF6241 domain-containing protein [Bacillus sp. 165]MBO9130811.1 hypothetical protein [Bacillus sp. 165]